MEQDEFNFDAPSPDFSDSRFNGEFYDPAYDDERLSKQIGRVYAVMIDGEWKSLPMKCAT
jgi:hypothetical protein